jgi:hypothetical protein
VADNGKLTYHTEFGDPQPPDDRLARIADAARKAAEEHPEHQDADQLIVIISGLTDTNPAFAQGSGLFADGYEDLAEIIDTLIQNIEALYEAKTGRPTSVMVRRLEDVYKPSTS